MRDGYELMGELFGCVVVLDYKGGVPAGHTSSTSIKGPEDCLIDRTRHLTVLPFLLALCIIAGMSWVESCAAEGDCTYLYLAGPDVMDPLWVSSLFQQSHALLTHKAVWMNIFVLDGWLLRSVRN